MRLPRLTHGLLLALPLLMMLPRPPGFHRMHLFTLAVLVAVAGLVLLPLAGRKATSPRFPRVLWLAAGLMVAGYLLAMTQARAPLTGWLTLSHRLAGLALILAYAHAARSPQFLRQLLVVLAAAVLAGAGWMLVQLIASGFRAMPIGPLQHANVWIYTISVFLPWAWLAAMNASGVWKRVAWSGVLLAALLLPFSRSAGLVLAWTVVGLVAVLRWTPWAMPRRALAALALVGLMGAGMAALTLAGSVTTADRWDLVRGGWALWTDQPVLGIGPGQFAYQFPAARPLDDLDYAGLAMLDPPDHVHVEPLHTVLEGGLAAGIGLLLLVGIAGYGLVKAGRRRTTAPGSAGRLAIDSVQLRRAAAASLLLAVVHGALTLAPTREGLLPAAMALGLAVGIGWSGEGRGGASLARGLLVALAAALLLSLPLHERRLAADRLYNQARDWSRYYKVASMDTLRSAIDAWPEELESQSLLLHELDVRGRRKGEPQSRRKMLEESVARAHTLSRLAPQSFKTPIFLARALQRLGRHEEARRVLNDADRFAADPETQSLIGELNNTSSTDAAAPENGVESGQHLR